MTTALTTVVETTTVVSAKCPPEHADSLLCRLLDRLNEAQEREQQCRATLAEIRESLDLLDYEEHLADLKELMVTLKAESKRAIRMSRILSWAGWIWLAVMAVWFAAMVAEGWRNVRAKREQGGETTTEAAAAEEEEEEKEKEGKR